MLYTNVHIDAFGYELAPNVVTSDDIERRLEPLYEALRFQKGQLEALTGIQERRFWDPGFAMYEGAVKAGRKAMDASAASAQDIGMLIYGGVCRDNLEPATACAVSNGLELGPNTQICDVSNACLGGVKWDDPDRQCHRAGSDQSRPCGVLRIRKTDCGIDH